MLGASRSARSTHSVVSGYTRTTIGVANHTCARARTQTNAPNAFCACSTHREPERDEDALEIVLAGHGHGEQGDDPEQDQGEQRVLILNEQGRSDE